MAGVRRERPPACTGAGRVQHLDRAGRLSSLLNPELDCYTLVKGIREHCRPEETGAIFIDYIQKVRLVGGAYPKDRYQQLQTISDKLRRLAGELNIPIIVGAQLNRSVSAWPLSLDHIRESSDIGQDASLVLALKRERRANAETETLKVHVCKDRRGPAHYDRPALWLSGCDLPRRLASFNRRESAG